MSDDPNIQDVDRRVHRYTRRIYWIMPAVIWSASLVVAFAIRWLG